MPGGRPSKYDWDDKRDICYRLHVVEKKGISEIIDYFAQHFGVDKSELPSARLFRRQFTDKWNFPGRKPGPSNETEAEIAARAKQLWQQNFELQDVHQILRDEGYDINHYYFTKITAKHGLKRREGAGFGLVPEKGTGKRKRDQAAAPEGAHAPAEDEARDEQEGAVESPSGSQQAPTAAFTPEEQARRVQRLYEVQLKDNEAFATRKRRRRIRGFGHLPADAPGLPPRYASETTLDECKAYLHLSNDMYQAIRRDYEEICVDMSIERKKTTLEDGRWQASKDRLVRENLHLSAMMHPLQGDLERKANAIDVICSDVTKRMRTAAKSFTLADASNALGLSPTDSKTLRRSFYEILESDQYTTKLACGPDHWKELQQRWFDTSPLLQEVMASGDEHKMKCVNKLCRDATKRFNDDRLRKDPTKQKYAQIHYGPGPGAVTTGRRDMVRSKAREERIQKLREALGLRPQRPETASTATASARRTSGGAVELDPALSGMSTALGPTQSVPAYFRLAPASSLIGNHPRMWLGRLNSPVMTELCKVATSKAGAATVARIQGIIKQPDGTEDSYLIGEDDELSVYLEAAGEKATFVVQLDGGYA